MVRRSFRPIDDYFKTDDARRLQNSPVAFCGPLSCLEMHDGCRRGNAPFFAVSVQELITNSIPFHRPPSTPPPPKKTFPTHAHRFTVFLNFAVFPLSDTRTTDNGLQTFMVAVGTGKCKEDRNARTLNNAQYSKFLPPLRDAPAVGSRPTLELKDREKM